MPSWATENRPPAFSINDANADQQPGVPGGKPKSLWGTVPAIDVIKLAQNEGPDFNGPMSLLFAGVTPPYIHSPWVISLTWR